MRAVDSLREAADAVGHNKLRTVLSLLGMIIGTASVVAVMAAGAMMRHEFIDQADAIGARLIVVYNNWEVNDWQARRVFMQNRDVDAMRDLCPDARFSRLLQNDAKAVRGAVTKSVGVIGVDPSYWSLWPRPFAAGRVLGEDDERRMAKVCVLTEDYAAAFFPDGDALGNTLTVGAFDYLVVGVTRKPAKESLMNDGTDRETVFIPYIAAERTFNWTWFGGPRVFQVMVQAASVTRVPETANAIEKYLTRMYGTVDGKCRFKVDQVEGALKAVRTIFATVTAVVSFIAGISLLVSGIGIMNVMLVAVSERTREIGVRKAIGARASDIMGQFLVEALFICLLGGLMGVILGMGIARVISVFAKWQFVMPLYAPTVALGVSAAIGLVFGLVPARNAAALDPVTALTKE
jgi:ABC-type antimicrobial peptide transport system permease subunit